MGANCVMIHCPRCVGTRAASVGVRGGERDRRKERPARSEVKKEDSKCTSYLALSRPWDLMKFRSLYLDRNATSWLLFLK